MTARRILRSHRQGVRSAVHRHQYAGDGPQPHGAAIIAPLKNARLVGLALLANFVLVPALAYLIALIIPLDQSLKIGLIVLSTAAGAPFLPKLVQGAKGNIAFGVGLMVL